jgi:RNA polymerase-interacting CarD/CdnL/TRCF family regulator
MGRGESMFLLEQKVVYPGHGVAIVARIFEKTFGQSMTVFYELQFLK